MTMSPTEAAWSAGFFEGEGCILIRWIQKHQGPRAKQILQVTLQVNGTDSDVIEKFRQVTGGRGRLYVHEPRGLGKKPVSVWRVSARREVVRLLETWMPHFGERRLARAQEAISAMVEYEKRSSSWKLVSK